MGIYMDLEHVCPNFKDLDIHAYMGMQLLCFALHSLTHLAYPLQCVQFSYDR